MVATPMTATAIRSRQDTKKLWSYFPLLNPRTIFHDVSSLSCYTDKEAHKNNPEAPSERKY